MPTVTSTGRCTLDGAVVEVITHPTRRTELHCPACARRRAGQCLDCATPVRRTRHGGPWRCPSCWARWNAKRSEAQRAAHREVCRQWRRQNQARIAAYKATRFNGYPSREASLAAQRRYYREVRAPREGRVPRQRKAA